MVSPAKSAGYPLKRPLDLLLSGTALVVLSPLIAVAALLVRILLGAPVLYVQERPGLDGRPFRMYKFRSMTNARDATGALLPDERRLTTFGLFIRRCSIDELPGLFNVARGDMSLVGPRPLLMQYLPLYTAHQNRRHEVRPGLTGWAQVNGRDNISWEYKFDMDVWYVDNVSFSLDIRILARTIANVLTRRDILNPGDEKMTYFTGTRTNISEDQEGMAISGGLPDRK